MIARLPVRMSECFSSSLNYDSHIFKQCLARKVPDLCKPYTPGKAEQDISARLLRVERILEAALPQYCTGSLPTTPLPQRNGSIQHSPPYNHEDDSGSQTEDQEPVAAAGSFQSGKWYGASASGSVAPASFLEQVSSQ